MKNGFNYLMSGAVMLLISFLSAPEIWAQPPLPGSPQQAPLDGGLSILAIAGGAYALKKFRDHTKKL